METSRCCLLLVPSVLPVPSCKGSGSDSMGSKTKRNAACSKPLRRLDSDASHPRGLIAVLCSKGIALQQFTWKKPGEPNRPGDSAAAAAAAAADAVGVAVAAAALAAAPPPLPPAPPGSRAFMAGDMAASRSGIGLRRRCRIGRPPNPAVSEVDTRASGMPSSPRWLAMFSGGSAPAARS